MFKADGEVVAGGATAGGQPKPGSYQLTGSVHPVDSSNSRFNSQQAQPGGNKQLEEAHNRQLAEEKRRLQKELGDAKVALQVAQEHMGCVRSQLGHLQEKASSCSGRLMMLRQQAAKGGDVHQLQEALQEAWARCDAAATEAEQHQTAAAAAESMMHELQQKLDNALADSMGSRQGKAKQELEKLCTTTCRQHQRN